MSEREKLVTWHRVSDRERTGYIGVLYVGTVLDWTPSADLFGNPKAIREKPWRATFSTDEMEAFDLGRYATVDEATAAVEAKLSEVLAPFLPTPTQKDPANG